jgi:hypothetical protein
MLAVDEFAARSSISSSGLAPLIKLGCALRPIRGCAR